MSRRKAAITLIAILVALLLLGAMTSCSTSNPRSATCTVVDKDRSSSDTGSVFRVYTEGCGDEYETLSIADNLLKGQFNAADVYAKIKVGETYNFEISGIRNGLISYFPEIDGYSLASKTS